MADLPHQGPATVTPRWVKLFGVIAVLLFLLLVIMLLTGGHGPRRHMPSPRVTEQGVRQP